LVRGIAAMILVALAIAAAAPLYPFLILAEQNRSRSRHHLSRSGGAVQLECFRCGIPASVPVEVTLIRTEQAAV
jgi:hypothetical protein